MATTKLNAQIAELEKKNKALTDELEVFKQKETEVQEHKDALKKHREELADATKDMSKDDAKAYKKAHPFGGAGSDSDSSSVEKKPRAPMTEEHKKKMKDAREKKVAERNALLASMTTEERTKFLLDEKTKKDEQALEKAKKRVEKNGKKVLTVVKDKEMESAEDDD